MAVTASAQEQQTLLDVQAHDTKLLQLAHQRASIPEVSQVQDLEVQIGSLDLRIVAATTEVADLELAVRKAENDVEQVVQRATRDQERLDSGAVSAAKELESLQHEIATLQKRQAELEEVELELMERLEDARNALTELRTQYASAVDQLTQVQARLNEQLQVIDQQVQEITTQRDGLTGQVPAELLTLYNKIREDLGGIGAALLQRGACQGCRIALDAGEINRIRALAPETVVRCEECRRILVRTQESGL